MDIDWHAERADLASLCLLDRDPADAEIDQVAVRAYRLGRVREQMARLGIDACLLFDPINIRYATGARNMQVFSQRNPARYLFLPLTGPVIMFEFAGCEHLASGLETIDEVRTAITASFVAAGPHITERERLWARESAALVREHCGAKACVGIERVNAGAAISLSAEGLHIVDAQYPVELARAIKSDEELKCVRSSIRATERAVEVLRSCLEPGLTEQQLWSFLHQGVIAQGGDYIETRLLNSGERTNPWFQEASDRVIEPNELVALDTDVVGCFGYYADFSRTFHSGPDRPTEHQKTLYKTSLEQIRHNMAMVHPGMTFREYSEHAWDIPERFLANRYYLSAHGCGMSGEYPYLYHRMDYEYAGYDGLIEPNMTLCFESYIGEEGGREGVKLEEHCLVTEDGLEVLSTFPFEEALLDESIHAAPDLRVVAGDRRPADAAPAAEAPTREGAAATPAARTSPRGPRCGVAAEPDRAAPPVSAGGEEPARPRSPAAARVWNTRPPAAAADPALPPGLLERVDLTLLGHDLNEDDLVACCLRAAERGITSIAVPTRHVRAAVTALCSHPVTVRTVVGLPGSGGTPATQALEVRQALRAGARAIDLVLDIETLRAGDQRATFDHLRRVIDPARDARATTTVVVECARLSEGEQVVAGRLAARVRPDFVATGSGIDPVGADTRQVVLLREATRPRRRVRALLAPGGGCADELIAAGAERLGLAGAIDSFSGSLS